MQKIADVKYAAAVLQWDQEVYLPAKGKEARARQLASLNEIAHQQFTDESLGALLQDLSGLDDLADDERRNVQLTIEDYTRNKKLPAAFVRQLSEAISAAYYAWANARSANDFSIFLPQLERIIALKQQEADLLGYAQHRYDALMNDYDKGLTVEIADQIFDDLRPQLLELINLVRNQPPVDDHFLRQYFSRDRQWAFGMELLKRIGFDFEAGRQDISLHPFTTNFSSRDVRVTTRVDEHDLANMTWSCIHEGGHALYEQGLPDSQYGLPLGEFCSLSIHESQSRLWENCIGRGRPFWEHNFKLLQSSFPRQAAQTNIDDFYRAINAVRPSLIRTEADELTYHSHVMIRYEVEKLLISGNLQPKDIPAYWNELYKKYLGVDVPDDNHGCLQDIHWSHGSFGYFATYSLGSLYAAQLYAAIERDLPSIESDIAAGNAAPIHQWLKDNIYKNGRYYSSEDLCKKATGEPLLSKYFVNYATKKYRDIYSI